MTTKTGTMKETSLESALDGVESGMTVMIGGWGGCGSPDLLIGALAERALSDLTVIMLGSLAAEPLNAVGSISKLISSYASYPGTSGASMALERRLEAGELTVELCSQGILSERIRAGGAGIPAFYVEQRVVGQFSSTDEVREFNGVPCVLETALRADVALVAATAADRSGNLTWSDGERNVNEAVAFAADLVVVQTSNLYEVGALPPEQVMAPGLVVDRIVRSSR